MAADQSVYIAVQLVVTPSRIRQVEELAMFDRERLELTIRAKWLEELCSSPRVCAQNHSFALLIADHAFIDKPSQECIGTVEEGFKP